MRELSALAKKLAADVVAANLDTFIVTTPEKRFVIATSDDELIERLQATYDDHSATHDREFLDEAEVSQ